MKALFTYGLIFSSLFTTSNAFAGVAIEKLLAQVEAHVIFKQTTSEGRCPDAIIPKLLQDKPDWALETDTNVYLAGQRLTPNGESTFVHLNNSFILRQDLLEGVWHVFSQRQSPEMGIGNEEKYREGGGLLESEFRVFGVPSGEEIAKTTILYDANSNEFAYLFTAGKLRPINCKYAPTKNLPDEQ